MSDLRYEARFEVGEEIIFGPGYRRVIAEVSWCVQYDQYKYRLKGDKHWEYEEGQLKKLDPNERLPTWTLEELEEWLDEVELDTKDREQHE